MRFLDFCGSLQRPGSGWMAKICFWILFVPMIIVLVGLGISATAQDLNYDLKHHAPG